MKSLLTILLITASFSSYAQLTPAQEKQVKAKDDSLAKVLRLELKAWTDNKRTIDSAQNMNLKRDSSDLVTLRAQAGALITQLGQYTFIETKPMTAAEMEAFVGFLDKIKALVLALNGKQP